MEGSGRLYKSENVRVYMIDKLGHQAGKLSANQLLSCVTDFWVCTSETFSLQWFLR